MRFLGKYNLVITPERIVTLIRSWKTESCQIPLPWKNIQGSLTKLFKLYQLIGEQI